MFKLTIYAVLSLRTVVQSLEHGEIGQINVPSVSLRVTRKPANCTRQPTWPPGGDPLKFDPPPATLRLIYLWHNAEKPCFRVHRVRRKIRHDGE